VLKAGNIRDEVWTEADFDDYSWGIVLGKES
jgi:hypothetical protein